MVKTVMKITRIMVTMTIAINAIIIVHNYILLKDGSENRTIEVKKLKATWDH